MLLVVDEAALFGDRDATAKGRDADAKGRDLDAKDKTWLRHLNPFAAAGALAENALLGILMLGPDEKRSGKFETFNVSTKEKVPTPGASTAPGDSAFRDRGPARATTVAAATPGPRPPSKRGSRFQRGRKFLFGLLQVENGDVRRSTLTVSGLRGLCIAFFRACLHLATWAGAGYIPGEVVAFATLAYALLYRHGLWGFAVALLVVRVAVVAIFGKGPAGTPRNDDARQGQGEGMRPAGSAL